MSQLVLTQTDDSGLTAEELAEMKGEQALIKSALPKWRFNGSAGIYVDQVAFKADRNPDRYSKSLTGIILGVTFAQGLNRTDAEEEAGTYSQSWLCYSANKSHSPRLNPDLTEAEKQMVLARGAGVNCMKCPLARWNDGIGRAECSSSIRLLFRIMADEHNAARTVVLNIGGMSTKSLNKFLDENYRQRDRPWLASVVRMDRRPESRTDAKTGKTNDFWVATFVEEYEVPKSEWRGLMDLRKRDINNFERPEDIHEEMERDAPAKATEAAPSTFAGLDEEGNPVWGTPEASGEHVECDAF